MHHLSPLRQNPLTMNIKLHVCCLCILLLTVTRTTEAFRKRQYMEQEDFGFEMTPEQQKEFSAAQKKMQDLLLAYGQQMEEQEEDDNREDWRHLYGP